MKQKLIVQGNISPISNNFDMLVLIFAISLLNASSLFPNPSTMSTAPVLITYLLFWIVITKNIIAPITTTNLRVYINKKNNFFVLFLLFVFMHLFAYLRAFACSTIKLHEVLVWTFHLITIIMFAFAILVFSNENNRKLYLKYGIWLSLSVYIFLNVLLHVAGIKNQHELNRLLGTGQSQLSLLFGLDLHRDQFPMAYGLNNFGLTVGISLLLSLFILFENREHVCIRILAMLFTLCSFYAMLIVDSRSNFVLVFATFLLFKVVPFRFKGNISYFVLLAPFMIGLFYFVILNLPVSIISLVARSQNADDLYTMTERTIIWSSVLDHLKQFSIIDLFGYGIYGQATSGVSQNYISVFKDWLSDATERFSVHNFSLQNILDFGYFGFLFIMIYYYKTVKSLFTVYAISENKGVLYLCAIIIYILLTGSTEISGTVYYPEAFLIIIFACVYNINYHGLTIRRKLT